MLLKSAIAIAGALRYTAAATANVSTNATIPFANIPSQRLKSNAFLWVEFPTLTPPRVQSFVADNFFSV